MKPILYSLLLCLPFITACSAKLKPKTISFLGRYDGQIQIKRVEGIQLYEPGTGVNNMNNISVEIGAFSMTTWQPIYLTYPLEIEWIQTTTDGVQTEHHRSIDKLEGIEGTVIKNNCHIFVFFDEDAKLYIRYYSLPSGELMNSNDLFLDLGLTREGYQPGTEKAEAARQARLEKKAAYEAKLAKRRAEEAKESAEN
jgi:hypothetical protein